TPSTATSAASAKPSARSVTATSWPAGRSPCSTRVTPAPVTAPWSPTSIPAPKGRNFTVAGPPGWPPRAAIRRLCARGNPMLTGPPLLRPAKQPAGACSRPGHCGPATGASQAAQCTLRHARVSCAPISPSESKDIRPMSSTLFTSESVSEGHPDKIADQISDAVLDAILAQDKGARVACETMVKTGVAIVAGEITTSAWIDLEALTRKVILDIGYDSSDVGFDGATCGVLNLIGKQSPHIAQGVD